MDVKNTTVETIENIENNDLNDELLKYLNNIFEGRTDDCYIDEDFESEKLESNDSVEKAIKRANAECQINDANSKLKFRKTVTHWLLVILLLQMIFMNLIIGWLVISQTSNFGVFNILSNEQLKELSELTKWYISTTVVELISVFIYVIKVVFAKPNIN